MPNVSEHILVSEYECHHCHRLPPSLIMGDQGWPDCFKQLFYIFETLRQTWGKPLNVTSGYRCPAYNLQVGHDPASVHPFGLALDIDFDNTEDCLKFRDLVEAKFPDVRMGWKMYQDKGENLIHIDVGFYIYPKLDSAYSIGVRW